jgi:hypothetical protein
MYTALWNKNGISCVTLTAKKKNPMVGKNHKWHSLQCKKENTVFCKAQYICLSSSYPQVSAAGVQCGTLAFRDVLCQVLEVIQNFGKHCSCHLQGEYVLVRGFGKTFIEQAVGGEWECIYFSWSLQKQWIDVSLHLHIY